MKVRDGTYVAPRFPLSLLMQMEDIANQSQHPLLGKWIIALEFSVQSSGSLAHSVTPGIEGLPWIDGSQIATQLNDNCCYFHHSCGRKQRPVPSPQELTSRWFLQGATSCPQGLSHWEWPSGVGAEKSPVHVMEEAVSWAMALFTLRARSSSATIWGVSGWGQWGIISEDEGKTKPHSHGQSDCRCEDQRVDFWGWPRTLAQPTTSCFWLTVSGMSWCPKASESRTYVQTRWFHLD